MPQLNEAIAELRAKGFDVPLYPQEPTTDEERAIKEKYAKVLGSAVNPVLREGNSDRRVAGPVKAYAQKRPHKLGKWDPNSKTHVSHMTDGDFFSSELSAVVDSPTSVRIEMLPADGGAPQVLKSETKLEVCTLPLQPSTSSRLFTPPTANLVIAPPPTLVCTSLCGVHRLVR